MSIFEARPNLKPGQFWDQKWRQANFEAWPGPIGLARPGFRVSRLPASCVIQIDSLFCIMWSSTQDLYYLPSLVIRTHTSSTNCLTGHRTECEMMFVFFLTNRPIIFPLPPLRWWIKRLRTRTKIFCNLPAVCLQYITNSQTCLIRLWGFWTKIWQDEATSGLENNVAK